MAGYFPATMTRGNCALSGKKIMRGDLCFFLVLRGATLTGPAAQILTSTKDEGFSTGFRSVVVGKDYSAGRYRRPKNVYAVEEFCNGRWVRVVTWSQVVLLSEALKRGFKNPGPSKTNYKGGRTTGVEHSHDADVDVGALANVDVTLPALPAAETDEEHVARVSAEAEAILSKIAPPAPTVEDVAKAFESWGQ